MRFSGKFTDSALPIAVGCSTRYIADAEVHRHTTGPDAINPIFDNNQSGIPNWLPESRLKAMHNDVNILVPICIEVLDPQKVLKKFLLCTFQMDQIPCVVKDAERIKLVKVDMRFVSKCL